MSSKKILAVSSIGGHWIQLLRIAKPLEDYYEVEYMSTHSKCQKMVLGHHYYCMSDFSRWDCWKAIFSSFTILSILLVHRPYAIITTGAAPGLLVLLIGRILGIKCIWIDSIANVETLSASGRIACKFTKHVYTQWPHLVSKFKVKFAGNVLDL